MIVVGNMLEHLQYLFVAACRRDVTQGCFDLTRSHHAYAVWNFDGLTR